MKEPFWRRLRWPIRDKNPYVAIPLGRGLFGTGAGTFNGKPGVAIIPAPEFKAGKIGTPMDIERDETGTMREIPGGTIIVTFDNRRSLDGFIDTCIAAREFFPGTGQ